MDSRMKFAGKAIAHLSLVYYSFYKLAVVTRDCTDFWAYKRLIYSNELDRK